MKIELKIDGKNRTFIADFISARMVRRTIELSKSLNFEEITADELDILIDYLVQLFGNQFTIDDVYDGLPSKELIPTLMGCIQEVVGEMGTVTQGDPKKI
ncbi:phage tail assembly chaperone G [Heliorestis convoluta]|uniref:Uncharacterized protein n=1 Tax=Heliorestis convoluta TaxID=356322 RepID=A0A5Q2MZA2_9FIRM|nr:hypothetical protein [Heliorestis convoluta]QGG47351.1 hypothetical protein FTV88_1204 [Heliorestis convoluta]